MSFVDPLHRLDETVRRAREFHPSSMTKCFENVKLAGEDRNYVGKRKEAQSSCLVVARLTWV